MIGIGVTTYNRESVFEKTLAAIQEFTDSPYKLYVARDTDEDRRGVARRKNECLLNLKECEHIFLFDDDCHPKKKGWEKFIIEASRKTGCQHFIYNKPPFCDKDNLKFVNGYVLECFNASGGVLMFYTKEVIEKIGGFYTGYDLYGFEHIGHSMRIKRAQLTPDWFVSIQGLSNYIHSLDYDEPNFFLENSCLKQEQKWELTQKNKDICNKEDLEIYRPIIV
jgi:GT2 family glycosyltransferase